jgi:putative transposase
MPWLETDPMEQRQQFIRDYQLGLFSMTELCQRYQISRKTGYECVTRYEDFGRQGLAPRSRAPHHCPHRVAAPIADLLCATRRQHPDWGAGKLLAYLAPRHPAIRWPAASTAHDVLARAGLIERRRRRRSHQHPGVIPLRTAAPNDLWTMDFKGQFTTGDGRYCYPLTILDHHARYLLTCYGLPSTHGAGARAACERAFHTYGLPAAIRTDNGVPFATIGIHGFSQLNVWWMRLGIQHQRIQPGQPQQNGAHERMHKTLKRRAIRPARATHPAQQRAFDRFRREYNDERPHDTLDGQTPSACYRPSLRPYPARLPPQDYPGHYVVKKITTGGTFRFHHRLLFLATSLTGHHIGLDETDDGIWALYFNTVLVAKLDERDYIIRG